MGSNLRGSLHSKLLDNFIRGLDLATISRIGNEGAPNPNLQQVFTDLVQKVSKVYDTILNEDMTSEESLEFRNNISKLTEVYKEFPILHLHLFMNHRSTLISNMSLNANEQERNSFIIATVRIVGLAFGVVHSLNTGLLDVNRLESSHYVSSILMYSVRCLLIAAPYFGPMCFIASFAEYLRSKYVIHNDISIMEDNKEILEMMTDYLLEKDAMQKIVAEMFYFEIDEKVITDIDEKFKSLEDYQKIFAAIVVSNMKKSPLWIKDKTFLCKALRFSETEAAKEWYNRMLFQYHLVDQEKDLRVLEDRILPLKMISCTSSQPAEDLIFLLQPIKLPGFVLFGLHSVCLYYNIRKFNYKNKCWFSNDLRRLSLHFKSLFKRAQSLRYLLNVE